jgi:hypothetical protein
LGVAFLRQVGLSATSPRRVIFQNKFLALRAFRYYPSRNIQALRIIHDHENFICLQKKLPQSEGLLWRDTETQFSSAIQDFFSEKKNVLPLFHVLLEILY